jgi:hypothetical protein
MSWQEAWREERTPWDAGEAAPSLIDLVNGEELPTGRALVPGAGSGYDVLALASPDRHAVGLDLADGARERFESLRKKQGVSEAWAELVVANFFDWQPDEPFDVIWDYTFLCAIEPQMRPRWAERVDELLAPGGELVTLIFPVVDPSDNKDPMDGPPYPMSPELVRGLLEPRFEAFYLEPAARSHEGREGMEWVGRWRRP